MQIDLREPWAIGPVDIPTRLVLAPMAGVSVQAFRRQGRRFGAGLVCSEMVSCAGLHHGNERTLGYLRVASDEHPLAIQIFGSDPRAMAEAAREFGDIAENAEYDDAKNEQAHVEARIAMLEERLLNARAIQKRDVAKDVVSVGSVVRLKDVDANETVEYHIVGSAEANPAERKLSNESPVGKAILGRKKGETVEVTAPRGSLKFKILDIKAA